MGLVLVVECNSLIRTALYCRFAKLSALEVPGEMSVVVLLVEPSKAGGAHKVLVDHVCPFSVNGDEVNVSCVMRKEHGKCPVTVVRRQQRLRGATTSIAYFQPM